MQMSDNVAAVRGTISPPADAAARLVTDSELSAIQAQVAGRSDRFLADLGRLVGIDCGSYTKAGVDEVGRWVAAFLRELGAEVEVIPQPVYGDIVVGTIDGGSGARKGAASGGGDREDSSGRTLLLIAHLDTVFPEGTAAECPFEIRDSRGYGPGVTDMKSGLLAGLHALAAIHDALGNWPFRRLVFIANPDEEIGSPVSTPVIEELAPSADACLVLEAARASGAIVGSRKGNLDIRLSIEGRAAHAGVEPEKGRSAIVEAAHQVLAISGLTGRWPGVTANVGVIAGGTRPNVVAEHAELQVDVRATTREHLQAAEDAIREIAADAVVPDVRTEVTLVHRHWPMERLAASERLIAHAQSVARRLGFEVDAVATGGASDGNTTAGLGVPTIDGLGPIGGLDHSPEEYAEIDSIVPRTAMLAALIVAVARDAAGDAVEVR